MDDHVAQKSHELLFSAVKSGDVEDFRRLLAAYGSAECVEALDPTGGTLLHSAAQHGNLEIAKILIEELNFPVDRQECLGQYSALHWAVSRNKIEIVRFLLAKGADPVNLKTSYGESALDIAKRMKKIQIEGLLSLGTNDGVLENDRGLHHRKVDYNSLHSFLASIGPEFEELEKNFLEQDIDLDLLLSGAITDADLKEIGVLKLGTRKKIILAIQEYRKGKK